MTKRLVVFMIHPVQKIRNPTDTRFGYHDSELPMRIECAAEDYLTKRLVQLHRHRRDERGELAAARGADAGAPGAPAQMQPNRDTGFGCNRPQRLPAFVENGLDRNEDTKQATPPPAELGHPLRS